MQLKSLEIQGFKSFPDKTRLDFGQGLTVVVGPNGSGKSNISDAVRWVLGEQSTKSLRGSKMEDVIFSGTKNRRPQGLAQVTLTIDNAGRQLAVDSDEVSITRRLYRSGESEYRLNGASVRLRDIYEMLMDTGLGRDGYSIIGQGRIAEIVSARDKERREIFEEAAGISKFRYRKGEAEKRLAMAEDNLSRLTDILSELEGRVEPLRIQAEKAKTFLELSERKKGLELSIWISDLNESRQRMEEQDNRIQITRRQYGALEAQAESLEQEINDLYQQMQTCSARVERCRADIREREGRMAENKSRSAVRRNDIEHAKVDIKRLEEEIADAEASGGLLKKRLEELEQLLREDGLQLEQNRIEREKLAGELEELRRQDQEALALASELAQERQKILGEQSKVQADAITAASLAEESRRRVEQLRQQEADCRESRRRMEGEKQQFEALSAAAKQQEESLQNVLKAIDLKRDSRRQALEKQEEREKTMQREIDGLYQKASLLEAMEQNHDGFQNSVKFLLRQSRSGVLKGILGAVTDLIHVRKDCALALETALGASIQNVVVENEEAAKRAIGSLKRENAGRATLLPLTTVKGRRLDPAVVDRLEKEPAFVGLGSDLVRFDPRYRGIVESLLGRVAVVRELDSAAEIAKKNGFSFRIVTLDGQVINTGGSFTGGSVVRGAGILSRRVEMDSLRQQAGEKSEQLKAFRQEGDSVRREIGQLEQSRVETEGQLRIAREDIIRGQSEQLRIEQGFLELQRQEETIRRELKEAESRIEELGSQGVSADQVLLRYRRRLAEMAQKTEETEALRQTLRDRLDRRSAQENEKRVEGTQIAGQIQLHEQEKERLLQQQSDQSGALERAGQRVNSLKEDIRTAQEEIQRLEAQDQEFIRLNREDEAAITENAALRIALEGENTRARAKSRELSEQKESMSRELARLEEQQNALQGSYDRIVAAMWDEYQLTRSQAEELARPAENRIAAQGELTELKNKIRELGSVNLSALEEYKEVNERYLFLKHQLEDIQTSKANLEKLIQELTGQMEQSFSESFAQISANFSKIFVELFGGGSASLKLTEPDQLLDSGIEIFVEPPGKIIKNLGLLSGGEQAFVAIAIYFAILKYRPAAFCLLDEIEAALDDVNVSRFAQYLKRLGGPQGTQFIAITHRRGTMEEADVLYGVTMQEEGVSKLLKLEVETAAKEMVLTN